MTHYKRFYQSLLLVVLVLSASTILAQNRLSTADYFAAISDPRANIIQLPNYYNTFIQLSEIDTVRHRAATHRNFMDQFLEVSDNEKILPASRIYGFVQNKDYFRSARVQHRMYVFAQQMAKGSMNLYTAKNKLDNAVAEIDMRGEDSYQNTMLLQDERGKLTRYNNLYFVNLANDTTRLELINPKDFADSYLRQSPKAYKLMKRYEGRGKTTEQVLAGLLFTSGITYLLMRNEANTYFANVLNQDTVNPNNYIGSIFLGSAVVFFSYKFAFGNKKLTPKRLKEVVDIYNQDVRNGIGTNK